MAKKTSFEREIAPLLGSCHTPQVNVRALTPNALFA
jgi:hypothetical protein